MQWTKEWKEFAESSREKRKSPFLVLYMGLLRLVEEVTSMVGVEGEATSKSWGDQVKTTITIIHKIACFRRFIIYMIYFRRDRIDIDCMSFIWG